MLTAAINRLDRSLRARQGIIEYTNSPHCIFRMEVARSEDQVVLRDGTTVRPADRIIVLHLWNEHIPHLPPGGATLGWARRLSCALEYSLSALESYLASRTDLDDIVAIRAEMALAARERNDQIIALAARYGFEPVEAARRPLSKLLHRFGENILIAMLVLAHNPASFRIDTLRRSCTPIILSRCTLRRRFADMHDNSGECPRRIDLAKVGNRPAPRDVSRARSNERDGDQGAVA
jgi:hypothetical protein